MKVGIGKGIFYASVFLILMVLSLIALKISINHYEDLNYQEDGLGICAVSMTAIISLIFLVCVFTNIYNIVVIALGPRLYIVNYLRNFIR